MFLAPFKALFNTDFYLDTIKKSGWYAVFYTLYLFFISAVIVGFVTMLLAAPAANNMIDKVIQYTPDITITNGKISVNEDRPLTITPPELSGYKIVFDTADDNPVYPTQMETSQTLATVKANTIYFNYMGNFQESKVDEEVNTEFGADKLQERRGDIVTIVTYALAVFAILSQFIKIPFMILIAFATLAIINASVAAKVKADTLLKLACYVQAPATALFLLNFVSPIKIPLIAFVYIIIFALYGYFIFAKYVKPAPAAPKEEEQK